MSESFIGQIRMYAFDFAPKQHALCAGQLLPIVQNQALFSLLGTAYGGDGQTTFALPDLRGRIPFQYGGPYALGTVGGEEAHQLSIPEMGMHTHAIMTDSTTTTGISATPTSTSVLGNVVATANPAVPGYAVSLYSHNTAPPAGVLNQNAISPTGGSRPHSNMMPGLTINYSIALFGEFPMHG